ncbi:hypothetical protein PAPYR_6036 [Paratrimastix pyriformis]|uniref:Uncharacterized protein n=1 Tax=Paratrimastix pyriformis TaxID=342808 RepID=A0ABQ8UKI6_9EUKA|nr:hypothetical protein PAPYR_6036 [Paratrimastix pyriformis]
MAAKLVRLAIEKERAAIRALERELATRVSKSKPHPLAPTQPPSHEQEHIVAPSSSREMLPIVGPPRSRSALSSLPTSVEHPSQHIPVVPLARPRSRASSVDILHRLMDTHLPSTTSTPTLVPLTRPAQSASLTARSTSSLAHPARGGLPRVSFSATPPPLRASSPTVGGLTVMSARASSSLSFRGAEPLLAGGDAAVPLTPTTRLHSATSTSSLLRATISTPMGSLAPGRMPLPPLHSPFGGSALPAPWGTPDEEFTSRSQSTLPTALPRPSTAASSDEPAPVASAPAPAPTPTPTPAAAGTVTARVRIDGKGLTGMPSVRLPSATGFFHPKIGGSPTPTTLPGLLVPCTARGHSVPPAGGSPGLFPARATPTPRLSRLASLSADSSLPTLSATDSPRGSGSGPRGFPPALRPSATPLPAGAGEKPGLVSIKAVRRSQQRETSLMQAAEQIQPLLRPSDAATAAVAAALRASLASTLSSDADWRASSTSRWVCVVFPHTPTPVCRHAAFVGLIFSNNPSLRATIDRLRDSLRSSLSAALARPMPAEEAIRGGVAPESEPPVEKAPPHAPAGVRATSPSASATVVAIPTAAAALPTATISRAHRDDMKSPPPPARVEPPPPITATPATGAVSHIKPASPVATRPASPPGIESQFTGSPAPVAVIPERPFDGALPPLPGWAARRDVGISGGEIGRAEVVKVDGGMETFRYVNSPASSVASSLESDPLPTGEGGRMKELSPGPTPPASPPPGLNPTPSTATFVVASPPTPSPPQPTSNPVATPPPEAPDRLHIQSMRRTAPLGAPHPVHRTHPHPPRFSVRTRLDFNAAKGALVCME